MVRPQGLIGQDRFRILDRFILDRCESANGGARLHEPRRQHDHANRLRSRMTAPTGYSVAN
jgi:hypothetical protein